MVRPALQQSSESSNVLDKHSFNTIVDGTKSQNDDEFQCALAPIHYFEKLEVECRHYFKGVTGKACIIWVQIGASDFVIDTISTRNVTYVLPIILHTINFTIVVKSCLTNQTTSLKNINMRVNINTCLHTFSKYMYNNHL
jgi:hypothetical protein